MSETLPPQAAQPIDQHTEEALELGNLGRTTPFTELPDVMSRAGNASRSIVESFDERDYKPEKPEMSKGRKVAMGIAGVTLAAGAVAGVGNFALDALEDHQDQVDKINIEYANHQRQADLELQMYEQGSITLDVPADKE